MTQQGIRTDDSRLTRRKNLVGRSSERSGLAASPGAAGLEVRGLGYVLPARIGSPCVLRGRGLSGRRQTPSARRFFWWFASDFETPGKPPVGSR